MQGVTFDTVEKLREAAKLRREGGDFMDYLTDRAGTTWAQLFTVDYSERLGRFVLLVRADITREEQQREEFKESAAYIRSLGDDFYAKKYGEK